MNKDLSAVSSSAQEENEGNFEFTSWTNKSSLLHDPWRQVHAGSQAVDFEEHDIAFFHPRLFFANKG